MGQVRQSPEDSLAGIGERGRATRHAALTRAAFEADPDGFRDNALARMIPPAVRAVIHGCAGTGPFESRGPQRWAIRIALQMARWLDVRSEVAVVLKLAQDYGLRDEQEIRE